MCVCVTDVTDTYSSLTCQIATLTVGNGSPAESLRTTIVNISHTH